MTIRINNLTGGAPGVTVTNANSAGGGHAFNETDTPQTTVGSSITYSTSGGLPALYTVTGTTAGPVRVGWAINAAGVNNVQYAVFYVNRSEITGSNYYPFRAMNADSSSQRTMIHATSGGLIHMRNAANNNIWSSTTLTSGVRYRVELMWGGSTSSPARIKIFQGEGTTPVQDSGDLTGQNFGGPSQSIWWGQTHTSSSNSGKLSGRVGWSDEGWIGPDTGEELPAVLEVHIGTGVPTHNSVSVSQRWGNSSGKDFRLVLSTASNLSSPVYGSMTTANDKRFVKMSANSLSASTLYYGGVEIDGELSDEGRFTFRTAPSSGTPTSHSIVFGSCRWDNGGEESFAKMKEMSDGDDFLHGPAVFIADMGDNGYPDWGESGGSVTEDIVVDHYSSQASYSTVYQTMASIPWLYAFDNHDSGGDSSDKTGAWRTPVLSAYRKAIPHRDLPSSDDAIYQVLDWGRVRYILVDNRSERDPYADTDGPDKRMWSQEQEDWFIDRVAEWPWAVCVLGGIYCRLDISSSRRWGSYTFQFKRIHDRLNGVDSLRRLVWLAGDRHALAADLGTLASTRGVPQAIGAPFEQGSVDLPNNEPWDSGTSPSYWNVVSNGNMRAFGEASFTDPGGDTITFNFVGRTSDGTSRVTMTKELDVKRRTIWCPVTRL